MSGDPEKRAMEVGLVTHKLGFAAALTLEIFQHHSWLHVLSRRPVEANMSYLGSQPSLRRCPGGTILGIGTERGEEFRK